LSDLLHEINSCRTQLVNLRGSMGPEKYLVDAPVENNRPRIRVAPAIMPRASADAEPDHAEAPENKMSHGLFPQGCPDFDTALRRFLSDLAPPDIRQLDERVQTALANQFGGLVQVSLASTSVVDSLEVLMNTELEGALSDRLAKVDVGELFLEQYAEESAAGGRLAASFERALPALTERT